MHEGPSGWTTSSLVSGEPKDHTFFKSPDLQRDYLLVGSQGKPNLEGKVLGLGAATALSFAGSESSTRLAAPEHKTTTQYAKAFDALVGPLQEFVGDKHNVVARAARFHAGRARMIVVSGVGPEAAIAAHVLYPSLTQGDAYDGPASMLFVSRALTRNQGVKPPYEEGREFSGFDLPALVAKEKRGEETNLRLEDSVEIQALGAVCLLC